MTDTPPPSPPGKKPEEVADQVASTYFGVGTDKASRNRTIRQLILGAIVCAVVIPILFYWSFGEVGGLGWGTTIFFVAYCLLAAIGLYFRPRPEYHTPVRLHGDWADKVAAFWLVSCVFGPFLGWVITSAFPISVDSWRWLYDLRLLLAAGLPLLTALPMIRYLRGKMILVALPILVIVTMLAIWSTVNVGRDLLHGPILRQIPSTGQIELYLQYTARSLGIVR
jgi:hypothetical protein